MSKILVIDLETTGFSPQKNDIVEVGIVELDLSNGERKILFDQVVNPELPREVLEKTWIVKSGYMDVEEILGALPLDKYRTGIQLLINQYILGATAFNNTFDFGFLEANGIRIPKKLPCPMKLSTNILKIPGKYGLKWPNVEEAFKFFFPESDYVEKHRGADDAFHEAMIVHELYKRQVFKL